MTRRAAASVASLLAVVLVLSVAGTGAGAAAHSAPECSFPFSKTDVTGESVTVQEEPQRIVTLAPSAGQTMWEIGAKDRVVGVSKYADYLEGSSEKTNVSGPGRTWVVTEKVIALQPDLVLAPNVIPNESVEQLRKNGLTVYKFREADSVDAIKQKTLLTGQLVGACGGANETVTWMEEELSTVREAVEGEPRPDVVYTFFGFTAGQNTFIHEMIETAGGNNIAAEAGVEGFKELNPEIVANNDPQWLVLNSGSPTVPKTEVFNQTTAVQSNQTLVLNENYISQPAPRVVISIRQMAKAFHPDAYAEANTTPVETPTETETMTGSAETTDAETTPAATGGGGPGFTPAVVAAALLALVVSLRRRG